MTPEYIVIHTAAFKGKNCDAKMIDEWHRAKGWNGIGYHFVILNDRHNSKSDGTVEEGRSIDTQGAHTKGINSQSIGICCIGHGDFDDFSQAQYTSLIKLVNQLMTRFSVAIRNVIGHREINLLIQQGKVSDSYRTKKSCPGNKVDMNNLRQQISLEVSSNQLASDAELKKAINLLKENEARFNNARDELAEFLNHPEIIEFG